MSSSSERLVNIPSYVQEDCYRYKMPMLDLKITASKKQFCTIGNLKSVAKALKVPVQYLAKYISIELETNCDLNEKNGKVTFQFQSLNIEGELAQILNQFIDGYLICSECHLPELMLLIMDTSITQSCLSCGKQHNLENTHKIFDYITENQELYEQIENNDVLMKRRLMSYCMSEEPIQGLEPLVRNQVEEQQCIKHIAVMKDRFQEEDSCARSIAVYLRGQKQIKEDLYVILLIQAMFTDNIMNEIEEKASLLKKLMQELNITEVNTELLLSLEHLFYESQSAKLDEHLVSSVLYKFYDCELLDEEYMLHWYDDQLEYLSQQTLYNEKYDKQFRQQAKDIMGFLRSDEDISDGDQEQDAPRAQELTVQNC